MLSCIVGGDELGSADGVQILELNSLLTLVEDWFLQPLYILVNYKVANGRFMFRTDGVSTTVTNTGVTWPSFVYMR